MFKSFVQDMRLFLPAEPKRKRGNEPDQNPAQPQRPRPEPDETAARDKAARMRARVLDCPLFANRSFQYGPACAVAKRERKRFLIYYPLGSGKTLAALHAARTFLEMKPQGRIIVLTTLSNVNTTWPDNIRLYLKHVSDKNNRIQNAEVHNVDWWFSQENQKVMQYNKLIRILEKDPLLNRQTLVQMSVYDLKREAHQMNKNKKKAIEQASILRESTKGRRSFNMLQATIPDKPYCLIIDECQEYINNSAKTLLVNALADAAHTTLLLSATPLNDRSQYQNGLLRLMQTPGIASIKQSVLWTNNTSDKPTVGAINIRQVTMTQHEWDFHQRQASARTTYNQSQNAYLSKSRQACNCTSKWEAIASQLDADCLRFASDGGPIRIVVYSFFLEKGAVGFLNFLRNRNRGHPYKKRIKYRTANIRTQATLMNDNTLAWFNRKEKKQNCKILLLTSRSGMGISLKNVRAVHLMEPQWSIADEDQAVGRATRKNSHDQVPRKVEVTRWLAVPPSNPRGPSRRSADQKVFASMREKKRETDALLSRLAGYGNAFLQNILHEFQRN